MKGDTAMQLLAEDDAHIDDCWNRIGVHGDKQCPLLARHVHCRNCDVYAAAATRLLDRYALMQDHQAAAAQPVEENTGRSMLLFRLGEEWLALATASLAEIAPLQAVHSLPHQRSRVLQGLPMFAVPWCRVCHWPICWAYKPAPTNNVAAGRCHAC